MSLNHKLLFIAGVTIMLLGFCLPSPLFPFQLTDGVGRPSEYKSEIRGVFIHDLNFGGSGPDWETITETCKQYGINAIYAHMITAARSSRFPTSVHSDFHYWIESRDHLRELLDAAHARGIEVHVCMITLNGARDDAYKVMMAGGSYGDGTIGTFTCPVRTHDVILDIVEELSINYPDIDGFLYDYIRYDTAHMCYCDECKAQFQEWLGEGEITDWTPFYPDGSRWLKYVEWRTIPVSNLVRDTSDILRSHKPDIKISVASWTYFDDCPIYWRKWIGQDTGLWIKEGWIDSVTPMHYERGVDIGGSDPIGEIESQINTNLKYMVAGTEGAVEYLAFLRTYYGTPSNPQPQSVADMKLQIDYVRSRELDGWVLWHYGGPGDDSSAPDIRNYLEPISKPDVFTISNIQVQSYETQATITWSTSLPATSKVEFSDAPLFTSSWSSWSDMNYWRTIRNTPTTVSDSVKVTNHQVELTNLDPDTTYYFRVQSADDSGVATSLTMSFVGGDGGGDGPGDGAEVRWLQLITIIGGGAVVVVSGYRIKRKRDKTK